MSIPPSLLSLNGNSEVVRDHEMRRAMKANVVDKMAVTPRLDLWGPLEHYPFQNSSQNKKRPTDAKVIRRRFFFLKRYLPSRDTTETLTNKGIPAEYLPKYEGACESAADVHPTRDGHSIERMRR